MNITSFSGFKHKKYNQYIEPILLEMLELSIKSMIENEDCFYCDNSLICREKLCFDSDLCKFSLFNGLEKEAKKLCRGKGLNV